jgi:hypothetical protein
MEALAGREAEARADSEALAARRAFAPMLWSRICETLLPTLQTLLPILRTPRQILRMRPVTLLATLAMHLRMPPPTETLR